MAYTNCLNKKNDIFLIIYINTQQNVKVVKRYTKEKRNDKTTIN